MNTEAWVEIRDKRLRRELLQNFRDRMKFNPSTKEFPGMKEPVPSFTCQVSFVWNSDGETYRKILADYHHKILKAFKKCLSEEQWLYATDVYHGDYRFYPHVDFEYDNPEAWKVSPFPNGDYAIFAVKNSGFGLFGHPWEQTICIFGEPMVKAFENMNVDLLRKKIRINGKLCGTRDARSRAG